MTIEQLKTRLALIAFMLVLAFTAVALYCIGADVRHRTRNMTEAQKDWLRLQIIAMSVNTSQTNWTLLIVPRTNSPSTN